MEYNSNPTSLTGYSHEEFKLCSLLSICHPNDRAMMEKILASPGNKLFEWRLCQKEGKYIPVETGISKFSDGKELAITRDLTDRKAKEEAEKNYAVQTMARKKDEDANNLIRHEFKNGIIGLSGLVNGIIDIINQGFRDGTIGSKDYAMDILTRLKNIMDELENTLNMLMAEAMAKELVNNMYKARNEVVDLEKLFARIKETQFKLDFMPYNFPKLLTDQQLLYQQRLIDPFFYTNHTKLYVPI